MPRLLWLTFHVPMSSPQITRMLGFFAAAGCWAPAGSEATATQAATKQSMRIDIEVSLEDGAGWMAAVAGPIAPAR